MSSGSFVEIVLTTQSTSNFLLAFQGGLNIAFYPEIIRN